MTSDGSLTDCDGDDIGHSVVAIFSLELLSATTQSYHRRHNRHWQRRHVSRRLCSRRIKSLVSSNKYASYVPYLDTAIRTKVEIMHQKHRLNYTAAQSKKFHYLCHNNSTLTHNGNFVNER